MIRGGIAINSQYQKIKRSRASQLLTLNKLLKKARKTKFGIHFEFNTILSAENIEKAYCEKVPIYDYDSMYESWWKDLDDKNENITWPGKVKYFALSSGTSGSPSKKIPITNDMILAIRKAGLWHLSALQNYSTLKNDIYKRQMLLIGGSTQLDRVKQYYQGDLSGILAKNLPLWLDFLYKPGRVISKEKNWDEKIDKIIKKAKDWDIGIISGVPSWIQLLFQKIIDYYQVDNIHDIWPNLKVYSHGGVSIKPYEKSFEKLLGKDVIFLETYLASEGFFAFENQFKKGMELILDNGIYYEFVPFNERNFSSDGDLIGHDGIVNYENIENNKEYALLISTCSGTWRYLIGDTVKFIEDRIYITGRTKHFLNLCGEHLTVDNMNDAIRQVSEKLNIEINEFTVIGEKLMNGFGHSWYIGSNNFDNSNDVIENVLDSILKLLNDDYRTERNSVLTQIKVHVIPCHLFYQWMEKENKIGGQTKFPRVLNSNQTVSWKDHVKLSEA